MKCKGCQFHMTAYLHGELAPQVRQRMTQHIQRCPICYTVYVQQRDMQRDLAYYMPLLGTAPRYDKMWASIQAGMARPREQRYQVRYAFAALMLVLALLLPWTMGRGPLALAALPTQPSPALTATRTPPVGGARVIGTVAAVLYSNVMTPEPPLVRAPGAPDSTP